MKLSVPPPLPEGRDFDVVGLGGNAVDYIVRVPEHPAPDSKVKFSDFRFQGGGRTATPMVAVSRFGYRARYLGCVGDDTEGETSVRLLDEEGVDTGCVRVRAGGLTQRAFILVDERNGNRSIIWGRSDGMPLQPDEVEKAEIVAGRFFYTDAQDPRTATVAAKLAANEGMPVLADLEDVRPGLEGFLPHVDYLLVSRTFIEPATGSSDLKRAMRVLENRTGGALVVVTEGDNGCRAWIDGAVHHFPAYSVYPVDTTGAGDVFHAGFAVACLEGLELHDALDFSNAVAAMKCRQLGGRDGIPRSIDEVEAFRRETPHRKGVSC